MASEKIKSSTVWMMAIATGLSVANLYYNQPLLADLQKYFGASAKQIGLIPTLTQLGYALGMLLLVPLGDMLERKKLVVVTLLMVSGVLFLAASAKSLAVFTLASFLIGFLTMTPALLIPFAAHLADSSNRGKVLGIVTSGLLIGILASRTFSGFVGSAFGWRSVFYFASILMLLLAFTLYRALPQSAPHFTGTYRGLLKSIWNLVNEEPILREAALLGGLFFAIFSSIWSTLIFLLASPTFMYGAREVGMFGLLGVAGAIAAPVVGRIADKKNPRWGVRIAIAIIALSVLVVGLSKSSLWGLAVGIFFMDLGVQGGHVSNQTRIFALREDARSRLNTVYMFCYFVGGATGSLLGTWAWGSAQWTGVSILNFVFLCLAILIFRLSRPGRGVSLRKRQN